MSMLSEKWCFTTMLLHLSFGWVRQNQSRRISITCTLPGDASVDDLCDAVLPGTACHAIGLKQSAYEITQALVALLKMHALQRIPPKQSVTTCWPYVYLCPSKGGYTFEQWQPGHGP